MFVKLLLRFGSPRPPINMLGTNFTQHIINAENNLRVSSGVKRSNYEELFKILSSEVWIGEARLKREFGFYYTDIVVADIPGLVNSLESKDGVHLYLSRSRVENGVCI